MASDLSRSALQVAIAQICQYFGWSSAQTIPLSVLTDITERYIVQMGNLTRRIAEHCEYIIECKLITNSRHKFLVKFDC